LRGKLLANPVLGQAVQIVHDFLAWVPSFDLDHANSSFAEDSSGTKLIAGFVANFAIGWQT